MERKNGIHLIIGLKVLMRLWQDEAPEATQVRSSWWFCDPDMPYWPSRLAHHPPRSAVSLYPIISHLQRWGGGCHYIISQTVSVFNNSNYSKK